jgi:hypothetical protein
MFSGLVVGKVVEQNRAEDGTLRFHVRRQGADVIGGRQFLTTVPFRNELLHPPGKICWSESQYNGGDLVDAKYCSGKLRRNPKFLAAELQCSDSGVVTPKYPLQYRRRKNETQNEKRTSTEKRTSNEQDGTRGRLNDCKLAKKTNAVRASHPDRIVFAKSRCPFSTHEAWGRAAFHLHSKESGR